jgi:hypothetical protein
MPQEDIKGKGLRDKDLCRKRVLEKKAQAMSEADEPCYRNGRWSRRPKMKKSRRSRHPELKKPQGLEHAYVESCACSFLHALFSHRVFGMEFLARRAHIGCEG